MAAVVPVKIAPDRAVVPVKIEPSSNPFLLKAPYQTDTAIERAKDKGTRDGSQGSPMDPSYLIGITPLQKKVSLAYTSAYKSARETRGSSRRTKRKVKRSKKTRANKRK